MLPFARTTYEGKSVYVIDVYKRQAQTGALLTLLQGFVETNVPLDDQLAWADELASGDEITVHSTTGPYYGDFLEEAGGLWLVPESREEWKAVMKACLLYTSRCV